MQMFVNILILLLLSACSASKKSNISLTEISKDSLYEKSSVIDTSSTQTQINITKAVEGAVVIPTPCDSLGNIHNFYYTIGSGNNKGSLYTKDGALYFDLKLDSIKEVLEKDYRLRIEQDSMAHINSSVKKSIKEREVVKVKWPWWLYIIVLVAITSFIVNILQRLKIL
ncbi:MAG: hypothetical protein M9958_03175 [Chitinophagales bacterium]|nr:hypothetical protein [Chitinophagales bacterium]